MNNFFGKQLRAERKRQHLTVEMVAEACGASRSYITLIETGRRTPGKKILPKLAEALQIKTVVVLNWYLEDVRQKMKKDLKIA